MSFDLIWLERGTGDVTWLESRLFVVDGIHIVETRREANLILYLGGWSCECCRSERVAWGGL